MKILRMGTLFLAMSKVSDSSLLALFQTMQLIISPSMDQGKMVATNLSLLRKQLLGMEHLRW